jgi:DNA-binding response OmpR family regulator
VSLPGHRVLIVEDDMMIAMMIEDMLRDLGCLVTGPVNTLAGALDLARGGDAFDAAILDVNLRGEPVFPVADALRARGVPVIFSTGYGETALREADMGCAVLTKPFHASELIAALAAALAPDSQEIPPEAGATP